jgi:hypothetical protein
MVTGGPVQGQTLNCHISNWIVDIRDQLLMIYLVQIPVEKENRRKHCQIDPCKFF